MNNSSYAKELITNTLFELLKSKSIDEITISEITKKAQVGRTTFYRNFKSKDDIIEQHLIKITDNFLEKNNNFFNSHNIKKFTIEIFNYFNEFKTLTKYMQNSNSINCVNKQLHRLITQDNKYKSDYTKCFHLGGIYNVYLQWIANGQKETPEEIANILITSMETIINKYNLARDENI